jgi:hypothetical protein
LLEHRYRYYVLAQPVVEDWHYDYLEKEYNRMAEAAGVKLMEMVDFDPEDPLAIEAKNRVDSKTDYYSLWEKDMIPVWEKLGKSRKQEKQEKKVKDEQAS